MIDRDNSLSAVPDGLVKKIEARKNAGRILLVSHERPDGDAVGTLGGLYCLLRENGYEADALLPDKVPDMYAGFAPDGAIAKASLDEVGERYPLVIFLDSANQGRASAAELRAGRIPAETINIDHHPDNTCFADINYVDSKSASTSQMLLAIAEKAGWTISPAAATRMLLGIISDSGCYRYCNTSPAALRVSARLIELGADREGIVDACYFSKPENQALFEAELLCRHMKKACGGKFAWAYLAPELLEKYHIDIRNTEQTIELLRVLDSIAVAAVVRREGGAFKVSLRSKDCRVSAGRIARRMNGGGHEMAAGCTIAASDISAAEKILINNVEMEFYEKQ